jgi:hypothetical protein
MLSELTKRTTSECNLTKGTTSNGGREETLVEQGGDFILPLHPLFFQTIVWGGDGLESRDKPAPFVNTTDL